MNKPKLVVGITQGDSNGIGYEVLIKSLADSRILDSFTPVVYGSSKIFGFYRKQIHEIEQMDTYVIHSAKDVHTKRINIVNCLPDNFYAEPGQSSPDSAKAAMMSLEAAVKDLKDGYIDVLVTGPINKRAMTAEGFGYTGHTEYLQDAFGAEDIAMIMVSPQLRVAVATGHIPLKDVPTALTKEKILSKLRLMNESLERDFAIPRPKIAVLGLNPHCGDGGLLGDEEQRIILPAVLQAQEEGILAFGPYSPDGYFGLGNYNRFDATLAMYHDQGLGPFKALAFSEGVNFTAGLPVVRTSPDHGTAYDMAGRDEADPHSQPARLRRAARRKNEELREAVDPAGPAAILRDPFAVGNEDHRLTRRFFREVVHQLLLGIGIEGGAELVQQQDRARPQQAAGDGDPLGLAFAQAGAAFAAAGVQPVRKREHEFRDGRFQGRAHLIFRRLGIAHQEILANGAAEERIALRNIDQVAPRRRGSIDFLRIVIQDHAAADRLEKGEHQADERALPRPGFADNRRSGQRREIKVQILQNHAGTVRIAVIQSFHANPGRAGKPNGFAVLLPRSLFQVHETVDGSGGIHEGRNLARQVHHRALDLADEL